MFKKIECHWTSSEKKNHRVIYLRWTEFILYTSDSLEFIPNPVLSTQRLKYSKKSVKSCFLGTFPIISWLHSYKKDDFFSDLISGFTVAIMHVPQGIGYALLGNMPPVVGIYMAFFPVLMYVIFGTSRHNSMGMWNFKKGLTEAI